MTSNSSVNNTASGEPSKVTGQLHSVKGTVTETIGNVTGMTSWQESGKEEHAAGESEYKAAQAKGYAEGLTDQVGGKKDSILGAVTGDQSKQTSGNVRENKGQTQKQVNA
ncbi:hypothetical protein AGABI1DRAFT_44487 [Agaricus bisporus var. burnettii JB137-S8]|uniref:CsbD-like domain-containing protein n=2 Tax=Agaricus bisporus var. burnettii TaxID=192524 RepID=K5XPN4_AGABU|nr:uncharacterized protein AGABI1DRAFT_44487 [Agaricus bisporus var. burnettii JB137-S8]EKM76680.1 hypothetical protein AGABI1DRAFT_44487 [Agaricus bisporus var. burnettii JB137-S8]KAF7763905.1 hypothetical protein Agabi119p4_8442 [Agaricus bisporus var. burnettii]